MTVKVTAVLVLAALGLGTLAAPAMASDHLFNAATAPGATTRGFTNPVVFNPSGTSGAMANPATVPGLGNPNAGADQGTPAVDLSLVTVRTDGHGNPVGP